MHQFWWPKHFVLATFKVSAVFVEVASLIRGSLGDARGLSEFTICLRVQ